MLSGANSYGLTGHAPIHIYEVSKSRLNRPATHSASVRHRQFALSKALDVGVSATLTCSCYDICVNDQTTALTMRADLVAFSLISSVGCLTAGLGHLGYLNLAAVAAM